MRLKFLLTLFGLLGTSGGLGAIIQSVWTEGAPSNMQFMVGGFSVAALVGFVVKVFGDWKRAGGKFDGVTTADEAKSIINSLCKAFGLTPAVTLAAEEFAPQIAEVATRIEARTINTVPGATDLLALIDGYFNEHGATPGGNHNAVLWKFIDELSQAIKGNVEGEDLIAKFRDQLDLKLFPGTPTPTSATSN